MAEPKKPRTGRKATEGVMTTVAKTLGGALGAIAGKAESLVNDHENRPAKKSPAKRSAKAASPKKSKRAVAVKQSKKAAKKRTPGRRTKG